MPISVMPTLRKALRQLESERVHIDHQIVAIRGALDGLGGSKGRVRRVRSERPARRRRRRLSATARRALSQRMKAYWAKRRGLAAKAKGRGRRGAKQAAG